MSDAGVVTPLLVCNIGWMSRYEGLEGTGDDIVGGGQFVGKWQEVCNFLPCDDKNVYGHVETIKKDQDQQIRIENIRPDFRKFKGDSLSRVDVVWIATRPREGGRTVVGWYRNATVYRRRQQFPESLLTPQHKKDEIKSYIIRSASADATLLRLDERSSPALRLGTGKGWIGEKNWWFPERQLDPAIGRFVHGLRAFIKGYDNSDLP